MQQAVPLQLRVLSGAHAGARLGLPPRSSHMIDHGGAADIALSDWRFPPVQLSVRDDIVTANWTGPHVGRRTMQAFVPLAFADVVLCIGPRDAPWPEAAALLARSRSAVSPIAALQDGDLSGAWARALQYPGRLAATVVLLAVILMAGVAAAVTGDDAPPAPTVRQARDRMQSALDAALEQRVAVSILDGTLSVRGLVADAVQAEALQALVALHAGGHPVSQSVSVAVQVAETIRDGLGIPGAEVRYEGGTAFKVLATVPDAKAAEVAVRRVAADLSALSIQIAGEFREAATAPTTLNGVRSTMVMDGMLAVTESARGVKSLVLIDASSPASSPEPVRPPTQPIPETRRRTDTTP